MQIGGNYSANGSTGLITGYNSGSCRLYVKTVRFNASDALRLEAKLSSGFRKTINFLESEVQPVNN